MCEANLSYQCVHGEGAKNLNSQWPVTYKFNKEIRKKVLATSSSNLQSIFSLLEKKESSVNYFYQRDGECAQILEILHSGELL
jgi:hypothetical protein